MPKSPLPALNLIAAPGQRRATLDQAREIERRGFAGIQVSSQYANMAQCIGLAMATERIPIATAIAPIYAQTVDEFAQGAAYLHEISGGRFLFGIGVAHAPAHARMEVTPGRPLADTRAFVEKYRAHAGSGPLPPVILAALRRRMIALAGEIADGLVFANGSLSHKASSLTALPPEKRADPNFFIGNRIRTCIGDDEAEAKAVLRRTVTGYALMPNYRNYWKEAGYLDEMTSIEQAVAAGRLDEIGRYLPDRWLADIALYGSAKKIRDGLERWRDAGIRVPCLVPLSADGDARTALRQVFAAFTD
jgi:alkanesulfonate monooxygenase SsuD/methylene tetrahydromethanopterin reductase-like flavin-dependent oxidoreductase (luciferase family)